MKNVIYLIAALFLFVSCSSPMENKYSEETFEKDLKEIKEANALDSNEASLLVMYFMRAKFKGDNLDGKTYKQILEEAKELKAKEIEEEKEQKELAEKVRKEKEEKMALLKEVVTVSLVDKGYGEYNYQDYISYEFAFENKTDKNITAFTGQVTFTDLFDKEIKKLKLTYDDGIKAKTVIKYNASTDYNQFMDDDKLLKSKKIEQIKMVWEPEKILFSDGTTLE